MTQISFQITNKGVQGTIYVPAQDPGVNGIVLEISSDTALTLTASKPMPEGDVGDHSGTLFYLHLAQLGLSATELAALKVTASGWTTAVYPDDQTICLAVVKDGTLAANTVLSVEIGNFTCKEAPSGSNVQLYMDFFGAAPISSGLLPFTYNSMVALQAPPSGKADLHQVLGVQVPDATVVQSISGSPTIRNAMDLVFAPGPNPKQVKAGPNTVFTVGFVYGQAPYGYGALTTVSAAFDFDVTAGDTSGWLITPPPTGSASPNWMFQPPDGQPILGTGGAVTFNFANIVTNFQSGVTLMVVNYSGVPGYSDGAFWLVISKEGHVMITSLIASPNPAVLHDGEASVDLSWTAVADHLMLMPDRIDVTGKNVQSVKITGPKQFTLVAQGKSIQNYASRNVPVEIFPVVNSLAATPKFIHANDFPHTVLLDWSVETNDPVILSSSAGTTPQYLPATWSGGVEVSGPQMLTVTPKDNDTGLIIKRNQVISAFTLNRTSVPLSPAPLAVAVSPTNDIYAVVQSGQNPITIYDTITNTPFPTTVRAGTGPVALAFSNDGSRFFVANGGDSTLSVFSVARGTGSYQFNKLADVALAGVPVALKVSADNGSIFVIGQAAGANPGVLDVVSGSDGTHYTVRNSVSLASKPSAVDALPSAAQVFVLSSDAKKILVIGYDSIRKSYRLVRSIDGFATSETPTTLVMAAEDSGTLLVPCSGSNSVYALDIRANAVQGQQKLAVGDNPTCIATVQAGAYAYVGNAGDNSLSLISCYAGYGLCKVVDSTLDNKASPSAIAGTEGGLVYVADGAGLSVWNNVTYQWQGSQTSATKATDVAASTTQVASWHNYNINFGGQGAQATPGLWIYDQESQTSTLVNDAVQYTTFLFWPDESLKMAVATQADSNALQVLETVGFTTTATVGFATSATSRAVAMTISRYGNTVFILVRDAGAYSLAVLERAAGSGQFSLKATVALFTETAGSAHALATVSDGSSAYVTDGVSRKLYVVKKSGSTYALQGTSYDFPITPQAMVSGPDDRELFIFMNGSNQRGFARFDIGTSSLTDITLPAAADFQVHGIAISPDGSRLFVSDSNAGGIRIFNTQSMQNVEVVVTQGVAFAMGIAVSPDGSGLFMASAFSNNLSLVSQLQAQPAELRGSHLEGEGGSYSGIFIRDYVTETPTSNTGTGWTLSPDIVPWGVDPFKNPADLGDPANYDKDYSQDIALGKFNNVYVRGKNYAPGAQKSRIYFYWATANINLYPNQWSPYNFTFNSNLQNWLDISAAATGDIAYSPAPLSWKPSPDFPHYCLIAWADNSANPVPPDLSSYANFSTWDQLGQFILDHPNVGWRNTNDVAAPGQFMNAQTFVTGPSEGGSVEVGVQLNKAITDEGGTIQFTLISSDGKIHYESPVHTIDTNTFSQTIDDWPANATKPLLTYTFTPTGGTLKGGEQVTGFSTFFPPLPMLRTALLRAPHLLMEIKSADGLMGRTGFLLGTTRFRYTG